MRLGLACCEEILFKTKPHLPICRLADLHLWGIQHYLNSVPVRMYIARVVAMVTATTWCWCTEEG